MILTLLSDFSPSFVELLFPSILFPFSLLLISPGLIDWRAKSPLLIMLICELEGMTSPPVPSQGEHLTVSRLDFHAPTCQDAQRVDA